MPHRNLPGDTRGHATRETAHWRFKSDPSIAATQGFSFLIGLPHAPLILHIWFRDLIDSVEGKVVHLSRINPEFIVRFGSVPISKKLIQTSA